MFESTHSLSQTSHSDSTALSSANPELPSVLWVRLGTACGSSRLPSLFGLCLHGACAVVSLSATQTTLASADCTIQRSSQLPTSTVSLYSSRCLVSLTSFHVTSSYRTRTSSSLYACGRHQNSDLSTIQSYRSHPVGLQLLLNSSTSSCLWYGIRVACWRGSHFNSCRYPSALHATSATDREVY